MKKNNKPCKKPKCKACYDKGYYTQLVGEIGSDDFGGEGYSLPPTIKKYPCPKCIRIQNGHKEDCDFVNSDQGVCNCFQPEQKECWRCNLGEPKEFHVCEPNPPKCEHSHEPSSCKHCRPQPEAQMEQKVVDALFNQQIEKIKKTIYPISGFASSIPPEQKECPDSDHLNHKDCPTKREWAMEAIRAANAEQAKVMGQKECIHKSKTCGCGLPQPTDGLIEWWEDFNKPEVLNGFAGWPPWMKDYIDDLLSEQKLKTKEDTRNNIEAIWTRLMNETDDPAYKEVYTRCIKALKI